MFLLMTRNKLVDSSVEKDSSCLLPYFARGLHCLEALGRDSFLRDLHVYSASDMPDASVEVHGFISC